MKKYSYEQLVEDIIEYCEGEMTEIDHVFGYDDLDVLVQGRVQQDFEYTAPTPDGLNPPWFDLNSRIASFDRVELLYELSEKEFTDNELNTLEKDVEL